MAERIVEMAYSRADAMEMCSNLGKQFVSHFRKIYDTGINARDFNHHCSEMQAWYDKVCESKLKTSKLPLNIEQIVDWFFTCGTSLEYLFPNDDNEDMVDIYNKFIKHVIALGNIKEAFEKILA